MVPDLHVCTDDDRTGTLIDNTSSDIVRFVYEPGTIYSTLADDINDNLDLATLVFREGIRNAISHPGITIEPGNQVTIDATPDSVVLDRSPGEQTAWQAAELIADTTTDQAKDALVSELESGSGPTGSAAISCAYEAYNIGQKLSSEGDSQPVLSQLTSDLGLLTGANECGENIEKAQEAEEQANKVPPVTLREIGAETHDDQEWQDTDRLYDDALRVFDDVKLRVHE